MRFHIDIYELVTENDHALVAQVKDVRVEYLRGQAQAYDDRGLVVAEMSTFDDDPIEIGHDYVKIEGVLLTHTTTFLSGVGLKSPESYGYWLLRSHGLP